MSRIVPIGRKDVRITARDRSALIILLAMPAVLILILNMAFGNMSASSSAVPAALVNKDTGSIGKQIAHELTTNNNIRKIAAISVTSNETAVRKQVAQGDLAAVLVIPANFSAKVASGTPVAMQVYGDPGRQVAASIFAGVAEATAVQVGSAVVTARTTQGALAASGLVTSRQQFGGYIYSAVNAARKGSSQAKVEMIVRGTKKTAEASFNAKDFYGPAQISLFLLFTSMFGAFAFLRERRENTLARMLTAPASRTEIVGGKMLGIWVIGMLQFIVLLGFTLAIRTNWGSVPGAFVLGAAEAFAATGLAMFYVGFAKTERAVGAIGPTVAILMGAAGGSWMPVFAMPEWIKPLHYFTINGWALDGFYALQLGKPPSAVLINVVVLVTIGLVLAAVGISRLRWER